MYITTYSVTKIQHISSQEIYQLLQVPLSVYQHQGSYRNKATPVQHEILVLIAFTVIISTLKYSVSKVHLVDEYKYK